LFSRAANFFGIANKNAVYSRSEKFWNLATKAPQINCVFCLQRSDKFWSLPTKAPEIDCILF
jgi:hypothetical protein